MVACGQCRRSASSTCGACRGIGYCSKACQAAHWPVHHKACVALQRLLRASKPIVGADPVTRGGDDLEPQVVINWLIARTPDDYHSMVYRSAFEYETATPFAKQWYDVLRTGDVAKRVLYQKYGQRALSRNDLLADLIDDGDSRKALVYVSALRERWMRCAQPGALAEWPAVKLAGWLGRDETWHACAASANVNGSVRACASNSGVNFVWRSRLEKATSTRAFAPWTVLCGVPVVPRDKLLLFAFVGNDLRIAMIAPPSAAGGREQIVVSFVPVPTERPAEDISARATTRIPASLEVARKLPHARARAYAAASPGAITAMFAYDAGAQEPEAAPVALRVLPPGSRVLRPKGARPLYAVAVVEAIAGAISGSAVIAITDARWVNVRAVEARVDDPDLGATFGLLVRPAEGEGEGGPRSAFLPPRTLGDEWRWFRFARAGAGGPYALDLLNIAPGAPLQPKTVPREVAVRTKFGKSSIEVAEEICRADLSANGAVVFACKGEGSRAWYGTLTDGTLDRELRPLSSGYTKVEPLEAVHTGEARIVDVGWCIAPEYAVDGEGSVTMALRSLPEIGEIARITMRADGMLYFADASGSKPKEYNLAGWTWAPRQALAFDGEALVALEESGTLREWRVKDPAVA